MGFWVLGGLILRCAPAVCGFDPFGGLFLLCDCLSRCGLGGLVSGLMFVDGVGVCVS